MKYLAKLKQKKGHPDELPKLSKGGACHIDELPKLPKDPFDSKDSMPGRHISEMHPPKIEPMRECLQGKPCPHLYAPGERRPLCSKADMPVFDMDACPEYQWAKQQPRLAATPEFDRRPETEDIRQQQAEAGLAVVANIKTDARLIEWAKMSKRYTYIGRGSKWGNPHQIGQHDDRATACLKYAEGFGRFHEIDELKGHVLGCYCHPEQCHGDFLAWWANGPTETRTHNMKGQENAMQRL